MRREEIFEMDTVWATLRQNGVMLWEGGGSWLDAQGRWICDESSEKSSGSVSGSGSSDSEDSGEWYLDEMARSGEERCFL